MITTNTRPSPTLKSEDRIRVGLLRQLAAAPLAAWPQALVDCLESLSACGISDGSTPGARPPMVDAVPGGGARGRVRSAHVRRICLFIRAHYDEQISVGSLAGRVGRNAAYVSTLFHRQTGTTIHRYLTRVRMRRAAMLLRRSEKVEAVMLQVGYRGKKNFYRQFEMAFGVTPGRYKANRARPR